MRFWDLEYLVYIEGWTAAQQAEALEWSVGKIARLSFHSFLRVRFPSSPMEPLPLACWLFSVGSNLRRVQVTLSSRSEHPFSSGEPSGRDATAPLTRPLHLISGSLLSCLPPPSPSPHLTVINDPQLPGPPC